MLSPKPTRFHFCQKNVYISLTKETLMRGTGLNLKGQILDRMEQAAPFGAWTPVDFLDFGTRDAVDQALHRLTRGKQIRRFARGLYDKPKINSLTGKPTNPDSHAVIDALSRRDQIRTSTCEA